MRIRRILHPTDFSESSTNALAAASALAKQSSAELFVVHVNEPSLPIRAQEYHSSAQPETPTDKQEKLRSVHPAWPEIKCERRMLDGKPSEEIVKLAGEERIDLIVMGTHGRTGAARHLLGSVAEEVVRHVL